MKPNFKSISLRELRSYLRQNRNDQEAWDIFFERIDREAQKSPLYPAIKKPEDLNSFLNKLSELKLDTPPS